MATIVTVLRSGGEYKPEHVTRLQSMVPGLICLSDVDIPGIECRKLQTNWPGWWAKMEAFGPSIEGDMLLIDLDTTVLAMPALPSVTTVLSDFYIPRLMGSGFMYVTAADRDRCWEQFIKNPQAHMARCTTREAWGDQGFLHPIIGSSARWGDNIVSYKVHCKNAVPKRADVVCFHGQPRPWDVVLPAKLL